MAPAGRSSSDQMAIGRSVMSALASCWRSRAMISPSRAWLRSLMVATHQTHKSAWVKNIRVRPAYIAVPWAHPQPATTSLLALFCER